MPEVAQKKFYGPLELLTAQEMSRTAPQAPKRPLSGYMAYCADQRDDVVNLLSNVLKSVHWWMKPRSNSVCKNPDLKLSGMASGLSNANCSSVVAAVAVVDRHRTSRGNNAVAAVRRCNEKHRIMLRRMQTVSNDVHRSPDAIA